MFTYGFIDVNLHLSNNALFMALQQPLHILSFQMRPLASLIFLALVVLLTVWYLWFLRHEQCFRLRRTVAMIAGAVLLLVIAFPAFSYDVFNYMTTAKVAFFHHENPYLVMPIEIANEPYLAFTRAANKVALYGPVWILYTAVPYFLGMGNIWMTIIAYKLCNLIWYVGFCYLIFKTTKLVKNVIFFAFNPLVLIEVVVSGHNDLMMMVLALTGLMLWQKNSIKEKATGVLLLVASWFVKGATVVFAPLLLVRKMNLEKKLMYAYFLLAAVFFVAAPIREELYPWYAVWLVTTASLMDLKRHSTVMWFTIVLSFALLLRYIPYMWMGYYEGPGPTLRLVLTVLPITVFAAITMVQRKKG